MSERHNSDGTAKSTTAKHALLLNRLVRMRGAPYYATAKDELSAATAGKVTIVKEKFYPADKELIEQLQAEIERYSIREGKLLRDNARLREALQSTVSTLQEYASSNPKHYYREVLQDPNGVHAALAIVNEALASTDSSNWLAEQKAQWREEIETKHAKSCDGNYIAGMRHGWNLCVNNNDEGFAKAIRLRRMAEQPESK